MEVGETEVELYDSGGFKKQKIKRFRQKALKVKG